MVVVWREAPLFSSKERAVLALTEAVTVISEAGVPQEVYEEVRKYFDESESSRTKPYRLFRPCS